MTAIEFVRKIEGMGRSPFNDERISQYCEKIDAFSGEDLATIYDWLISTHKFTTAPTIAHVIEAAEATGLTRTSKYRTHVWSHGPCSLCAGEGRVRVIRTMEIIRDTSGVWIEHTLRRIVPYSADGAMAADEWAGVARCSCPAGDAPTLPKGWPRWSSSRGTISRERFVAG